jgi:competence protein ComEC
MTRKHFGEMPILANRNCVAIVAILAIAAFVLVGSSLAGPSGKPMEIYFVDAEGGQATLFATPDGGSLLIDTGWPDFSGRDAERIVAVAKLAGLSKLDFVLLTHYHMDHAGGVAQLAARMPIGAFIDHGPNRQTSEKATAQMYEDYQKVLAEKGIKRIIAKVGDILPIEGIRVEVVSSDGVVLAKPLPGAGSQNPACATAAVQPPDRTENARSLGTMLTFGKARILDLGDLTWEKELGLVCPVNKLGAVDVFVVSHHGTAGSNSPALLAAIAPRIAIMDNGAAKGGAPVSWDAVKNSPRLEDLWQLHFSGDGGAAHNSADALIANPAGADAGNYLKVSVWADGNLEVFNPRTKASKHYAPVR